MRKEGIVVSYESGKALVRFPRESSCGNCGACEGRACETVAESGIEIAAGDRVAVEMPDKGVLRLSVLTYGVPLLALILGLAVGHLLWQWLGVSMNADLFVAIIAGVFLMLGFYTLHALQNRRGLIPTISVKVTELISSAAGADKINPDGLNL